MTKLLPHTIPKVTAKGRSLVTEYYQNRFIVPEKPYIIEKAFPNGLKYSRKILANGNTLEVFENNGTTHKVLLDIYDIPVAINTVKNGKKSTARFFADTIYSHIIAKFFDKTKEFVNLS